ncbi:MAG: membrane protein [Deltaproteobacteria bacterium]|jgi:Cu-processing system permease protein|nr:MAG: membrane protein [Deltaproteobacteria bacterium]
MEFKNVLLIMQKEVREALKNRWFIIYTVCFSILALLLLFFSYSREEILGVSGFGRTAASLINLVLLFVPLVSLVTGAISISNERENGTLFYLLSHPVERSEVFTGKFLGLLVSIWVSICLGFGLSGIVVGIKGGSLGASKYLLTTLLSLLLAASLLSIGFIVSVLSKKAAKSIGISVFLWLFFLVFSDLGIMGTTIVMDLGIKSVFVLALLNPTEVFKIAAVLNMSPRFEVLGPVGVYALRSFGRDGTFYLLFSAMILWTVIPIVIGFLAFTLLKKE